MNKCISNQVILRDSNDKYSCKIDQAMEHIYSFMQSSDECQFTIKQLSETVELSDVSLTENTIRSRLKEKCSDQVVISSRMVSVTYV